MEKSSLPVPLFSEQIKHYAHQFRKWVTSNWLRSLGIAFVLFLCYKKDVSFGIKMEDVPSSQMDLAEGDDTYHAHATEMSVSKAMNTSMLSGRKTAQSPKKVRTTSAKKYSTDDNLANTYSNLTYNKPGIATTDSERKRALKRRKQMAYIDRYKEVAVREMKKYGIPASITLAQGLLESNVGESRLAERNNNHFGMKCFSRSCKKGHCSNFTDDSHKDFFRVYKNSWESYRSHSLLLKNGKRYARLFKLKSTDYKGWAHGLKKAGYATDKRYGDKLINLIEDLDLHLYDQ